MNAHYPNRHLQMEPIDSDKLLYLSFFAYFGGRFQFGKVNEDPDFLVKILTYLVDQRSYMPAAFLKGFVYKYGVKPYIAPRLEEAKVLLDMAAGAGEGGAIIELQQFERHLRLNKYSNAPNRA